MTTVTKKRCPDCSRTKKAAEFYKNASAKDRLASVCKKCGDIRRTRCRKKNADANRAYARAYYAKPDQRAKKRSYYLQNQERCNKNSDNWRKRNHRRYVDGCVRRNARYRARKIEAFVEDVDRELVYYRDRMRCYLCGNRIQIWEMHVDHVIPLSRGGKHCEDNCRCACESCNTRKGDKLLAEYTGQGGQACRLNRSCG